MNRVNISTFLAAVLLGLFSSVHPKALVPKDLPIQPTSWASPVLLNQTQVKSRSGMVAPNVVYGYKIHHYSLAEAPIYRGLFPVSPRNLVNAMIPDNRALRVNYTEETLLSAPNQLCISSPHNVTLKSNISEELVKVMTGFIHGNGGLGPHKTLSGTNGTVTLYDNYIGQTIEFRQVQQYNSSLVNGTDCVYMKMIISGTMVEIVPVNPDSIPPTTAAPTSPVSAAHQFIAASGFVAMFSSLLAVSLL